MEEGDWGEGGLRRRTEEKELGGRGLRRNS